MRLLSVARQRGKAIGLALDTGPELWLNLENAYRLATSKDPDPKIRTRALAMA